MKKNSVGEVQGNDSIPGILRKTLAYNEEVMLCHFSMSQGRYHSPAQSPGQPGGIRGQRIPQVRGQGRIGYLHG